jgi:hypothetical protein
MKVAISCSISHSRLRQQKNVKLSASRSFRFTLQNVTTVNLRLDIFVVLRNKLGALKRVKYPKPNSFDIHLLNSIKKPLYDTTRPYQSACVHRCVLFSQSRLQSTQNFLDGRLLSFRMSQCLVVYVFMYICMYVFTSVLEYI